MDITPPRTFFYIADFSEVQSVGTFEGIKPRVLFRDNRVVSGHIGPSSAIVHEALPLRRAFTTFGRNKILAHLANDIVATFVSTPNATRLVIKHNGNFMIADELIGLLYTQLSEYHGSKTLISIDASIDHATFDYLGHDSVIVKIV